MREWNGKKYWLVGASEGLGEALAHKLSKAGVELVLSARSEDKLTELAEALPGKAHVAPVDVTDAEALGRVFEDAGHLDGVIQMADDASVVATVPTLSVSQADGATLKAGIPGATVALAEVAGSFAGTLTLELLIGVKLVLQCCGIFTCVLHAAQQQLAILKRFFVATNGCAVLCALINE